MATPILLCPELLFSPAVLGLCCCVSVFCSCGEQGLLSLQCSAWSSCSTWAQRLCCTQQCLGNIQRTEIVSSVQFSRSVVSDSLRPDESQHTGLPVHHQHPESTQTHVHWISDAIQPSHPLLSPLLPPSIFPSIRVVSNESALHIRWPKYWSFSSSTSPSNEQSGLISFRMD